jgi:polyisoprenoid-binding protein YceI
MKLKSLQRTETLASALLLTLVLACKPAKDAVAQPAAAPTAPPVTIEPAKAAASAAGLMRYEAQPTGSKMSIEGTSSLHDWIMDSVLVGGYLETDAKFPESALTDAKAAKPVVSVYMPVRSFKSGKASMDARMQKEMNEPQFKRIEYKLIELKPKSAAGATGALKFDAVGALTVVGKTLTNTMPVTIEKLANGKLKVTGSTALKMSDYGIPPPTTLGLFTTGDELKLKFEWLAAPKVETPKVP